MSDYLGETIAPKKPKNDNIPATISKPPETNQENQNTPPENDGNNIQFELAALDDAPPDDVLLKFLQQFDPITEDPPQNLAIPDKPAPELAEVLALMNTRNIQNVSNVQNVVPNQKILPHMYFGGNSTLTINYNFAPSK